LLLFACLLLQLCVTGWLFLLLLACCTGELLYLVCFCYFSANAHINVVFPCCGLLAIPMIGGLVFFVALALLGTVLAFLLFFWLCCTG